MKIEQIKVHDLVFDCRTTGNRENEMVILLHGFPETSHMWVDLMTDIYGLGFFCVAPNMRGYSKRACPKGKRNYTLDKLIKDVLDIAKHFGKENFHLIAHDWGAVIGWGLVHDNPNKILSWTALSVPHLKGFGEAIMNDTDQQKKSQYIKNFQVPFLPELNIRKNNFELLKKLWKYSSNEAIEDYMKVFKRKPSLTAALNYYRANFKLLRSNMYGEIDTPTLFIWGEKDMAIGGVGVENGHKFMTGDYKFLKLDAGHWLIQTKYQEIKTVVTNHLLKFREKS